MLHLTKPVVLIVLLCFCSSSRAHLEEQTHRIERNSSAPVQLVQGTLFITDYNGYPYAACETTKPKVEKVCKVTLIVPSQIKARTCTGLKIFAGKDRELFLGGYFQVLPYTPDHALLIWYDQTKKDEAEPDQKYNFKVRIIDMNECSSALLDFPIDKVDYSLFPAIVPYVNRIDAIVNSKEKCCGANRCILSYDLKGKQLGGVQPYEPEISQYANPVSPSEPQKGFFESTQNLENITVLLVDAAGKGKQLAHIDLEKDAVDHRLSFSSQHELYSICRMPNLGESQSTHIYCAQFDGLGNIKLNTSIKLPESTGWLSTRSLPEGGILLATSSCGMEQSAKKECQKFRVWKLIPNQEAVVLDVEGPGVTCYDMNKFDKNILQVRISEKKDDICFDFSCQPNEFSFTYVSKCISKKIL